LTHVLQHTCSRTHAHTHTSRHTHTHTHTHSENQSSHIGSVKLTPLKLSRQLKGDGELEPHMAYMINTLSSGDRVIVWFNHPPTHTHTHPYTHTHTEPLRETQSA